jgi:4-aminobutyrate aminotransferase
MKKLTLFVASPATPRTASIFSSPSALCLVQFGHWIEALVERSARLGETFAENLDTLARRFSCIGEIRHLGMLFAIDIVHPDQPAKPWPHGAEAILYTSLSQGLSFKVSGGSTLSLSPQLIIEAEQWQTACRILTDSVAVVMENYRQGGRV